VVGWTRRRDPPAVVSDSLTKEVSEEEMFFLSFSLSLLMKDEDRCEECNILLEGEGKSIQINDRASGLKERKD